MIRLKDIRMQPKLIGLMLLVSLIPLGLVAWLSSWSATQALLHLSTNQLESMREVKHAQISRFFEERQGDMGVLLETSRALLAAETAKMQAVQDLKVDNLKKEFATITTGVKVSKDDPFVAQAFDDLNQAFTSEYGGIGSQGWASVAEKYDARFKGIMDDNGWYDLFLVNPEGDIIYSATRESDLGMNLATSDLKSSSFGKAFAKVKGVADTELAIGDFQPYAPSNGAFAAFIIGKLEHAEGYLAMQMPTDSINAIVQQRAGLGKNSETYLVGELDGVTSYRSDRVVKGGKIGGKKSSAEIKAALSGESGTHIVTGSTGNVELVAYSPVDIPGLNWISVTSGSLEEVLAVKAEGEELDYFGKYIEKYGYYDLFLIHPEGKVFYSVGKEADYNTNMVHGKYKDSGLGKLVRKVLQTGNYGVADFESYAPSNGDPAGFIAQPYMNKGKVELIVALQLSLEAINVIMQQRDGMGETGETYLVGSDKLMRSDSFLDPEGHSVKASFAGTVENNGVDTEGATEALAGRTATSIIMDYNGNPVLSSYKPIKVGDTQWALLAEVDEAEIMQPVEALIWEISAAGVGFAVLIAIIALLIARSITRPIQETVAAARSLAEGDLTVDIHVDAKDETGQLLAAMKELVARLVQIMSEVKGGADNLASASQEVSATAQTISQGATEQASGVEETSSAVEQLNASVQQNTENAQVTDGIATKSAEEAQRGGDAVNKTVSAMKTIASKISLIEDIAYKTNLLSLNAAIEAARAGEHGKGFAVVATEVRKLAETSRLTAEEINGLASGSVEIAEQAGNLLEEMVPNIQKTADLVQEISAASAEQSSGVTQINDSMTQLDKATQQNASASEELAATAEELSGQAEQLQQSVAYFKLANESHMANSQASVGLPKTRPQPAMHHSAPTDQSGGSNDEFDDEDFQKF